MLLRTRKIIEIGFVSSFFTLEIIVNLDLLSVLSVLTGFLKLLFEHSESPEVS